MHRIELIYFESCPNIDAARSAIRSAGVDDFSEVNLNQTGNDESYRNFSSPTILLNGRVIVGAVCNEPACSIVDWSMVKNKLRTAIDS